MEADARTNFMARLAERGLSLDSFDGHTILLHYDAEADAEVNRGHKVNAELLSRYVRDVMTQLPGAESMFPGLQTIEVEVSVTS